MIPSPTAAGQWIVLGMGIVLGLHTDRWFTSSGLSPLVIAPTSAGARPFAPVIPPAADTAYKIPNGFTLSVPRVAVTSFGARPDDGRDDTEAFRRAARGGARAILIPCGTYQLSGEIELASRTRIYGESCRPTVVQSKLSAPVFAIKGTKTAFVDSVIIEGLSFRGIRKGQTVVLATAVRHLIVRNNVLSGIGLLTIGTPYNPNRWDKTRDPNATAGLVREAQLSSHILVTHNVGNAHQPVGARDLVGVNLSYAADAAVAVNRLANYSSGVMWWGGDANPERGGSLEYNNPRWARRILIAENEVFDADAGAIWGSMGQDILVANNRVGRCEDVCLDAEGSFRVLFTGNRAENAKNAVLAVFFFSRDIRFTHNTVIQDGSMGRVLFRSWNVSQHPGQIDIILRENAFTYTGPAGVGLIEKESSRTLLVQENRLRNVIMSLVTNNAGDVRVFGNEIHLTRSTDGRSAIEVGMNHGPARPELVRIANNVVTTSVPQRDSAFGIFIRQAIPESAPSLIEGNRVVGFRHSIGGQGPQAIRAIRNRVTGTIRGWGNVPAQIQEQGTVDISGVRD